MKNTMIMLTIVAAMGMTSVHAGDTNSTQDCSVEVKAKYQERSKRELPGEIVQGMAKEAFNSGATTVKRCRFTALDGEKFIIATWYTPDNLQGHAQYQGRFANYPK